MADRTFPPILERVVDQGRELFLPIPAEAYHGKRNQYLRADLDRREILAVARQARRRLRELEKIDRRSLEQRIEELEAKLAALRGEASPAPDHLRYVTQMIAADHSPDAGQMVEAPDHFVEANEMVPDLGTEPVSPIWRAARETADRTVELLERGKSEDERDWRLPVALCGILARHLGAPRDEVEHYLWTENVLRPVAASHLVEEALGESTGPYRMAEARLRAIREEGT